MAHKCKFEDKIGEMHDGFIEMRSDIKYIKKCLEGNGTKGLVQTVRENSAFRYKAIGAIIVIPTLIAVAGHIIW